MPFLATCVISILLHLAAGGPTLESCRTTSAHGACVNPEPEPGIALLQTKSSPGKHVVEPKFSEDPILDTKKLAVLGETGSDSVENARGQIQMIEGGNRSDWVAGWVGRKWSDLHGQDQAADLKDEHVIKLCAAASCDAYEIGKFSAQGCGYLELIDQQLWDGYLQWTLYQTHNPDKGTILAFMGTANLEQAHQDLHISYGGHKIKKARDEAVAVAKEKNPSYITGHSLGGLLAECATSYTGIPGVAFAPPGPVGTPNLADGGKYDGVEYKVIIDPKDKVKTVGRAGGWQSSHIVSSDKIRYVDNGCHSGQVLCPHSIVNLAKTLGLLGDLDSCHRTELLAVNTTEPSVTEPENE